MRLTLTCLAGLALGTTLAFQAGCKPAAAPPEPEQTATGAAGKELQIVSDIDKRVAQFAPTPLNADLSALTAEDRQVLDKLVEASKLMNEIYLRQAWTGNPAMREQLKGYTGPNSDAVRQYFTINFGPWDRL